MESENWYTKENDEKLGTISVGVRGRRIEQVLMVAYAAICVIGSIFPLFKCCSGYKMLLKCFLTFPVHLMTVFGKTFYAGIFPPCLKYSVMNEVACLNHHIIKNGGSKFMIAVLLIELFVVVNL